MGNYKRKILRKKESKLSTKKNVRKKKQDLGQEKKERKQDHNQEKKEENKISTMKKERTQDIDPENIYLFLFKFPPQSMRIFKPRHIRLLGQLRYH